MHISMFVTDAHIQLIRDSPDANKCHIYYTNSKHKYLSIWGVIHNVYLENINADINWPPK